VPVVGQTSVVKPVSQQDTLVVVEDNPDMLAYLQLILTPQYALQPFSSGQTAWQWLRKTGP